MTSTKNKTPGEGRSGMDLDTCSNPNPKRPRPTGQCGFVLGVIKENPGVLSLKITADLAVPEAAARIHQLRQMGFNIHTRINPVVTFRGVERHNVASYFLVAPEWPAPGFLDGSSPDAQLGLDLGECE